MATYFITGASGYIGGSIAHALIRDGDVVRGLVRSSETAALLQKRGIVPVIGLLEDTAVLTREALASDGVINTASADDRAAIKVFVDALAGSGKPLVHTSGSSVVGDDARGNFKSDRIFDEDTSLLVHSHKKARHDIDLTVLRAANHGVRSVVICPGLIYGNGRGLKQTSVQMPFLVDQARQRGHVVLVGSGANVWSTVHIDDVVDLYLRALRSAPAGAFYFAENGEASFLELGQALLAKLGLRGIENLPADEAATLWGEARAYFSLGSNSRVRAKRARQDLGWAPRHSSAVDWILQDMTC